MRIINQVKKNVSLFVAWPGLDGYLLFGMLLGGLTYSFSCGDLIQNEGKNDLHFLLVNLWRLRSGISKNLQTVYNQPHLWAPILSALILLPVNSVYSRFQMFRTNQLQLEEQSIQDVWNQIQEWFTDGEEKMQQNEFGNAINLFNQAKQKLDHLKTDAAFERKKILNRFCLKILFKIAQCYYQTDQYEEAIQKLEKIFKEKKDNLDVLILLGTLYLLIENDVNSTTNAVADHQQFNKCKNRTAQSKKMFQIAYKLDSTRQETIILGLFSSQQYKAVIIKTLESVSLGYIFDFSVYFFCSKALQLLQTDTETKKILVPCYFSYLKRFFSLDNVEPLTKFINKMSNEVHFQILTVSIFEITLQKIPRISKNISRRIELHKHCLRLYCLRLYGNLYDDIKKDVIIIPMIVISNDNKSGRLIFDVNNIDINQKIYEHAQHIEVLNLLMNGFNSSIFNTKPNENERQEPNSKIVVRNK